MTQPPVLLAGLDRIGAIEGIAEIWPGPHSRTSAHQHISTSALVASQNQSE